MIDVRFYENKGKLCLKVEGHANAAPKGEDIVCAGVSALAVALADTLEMMHRNGDLEEAPEIRAKDGDMRVKVKAGQDHKGRLLLAFLYCQTGMLAIWRGYPKNVQIKTFDKAEIEAFSKGPAHPDGQIQEDRPL